MNYVITGATGDVGSRVVKQLLERDIRPRILVRDQAKAAALFGDRVDVVTGDLAEPADLRRAFDGFDVVYLVNVGPQIPQRDEMAAMVAKQKGVKRIIKLSSLDVEHGLAIGAWHEKGEIAIRASGVPYTFVRPSGFMSNLLAWSNSIKREGVVRSSAGEGHRPFIHSEDIASVSVEALLSESYRGKSLSLTGPESLTFGQATEIVATAIGKQLEFQSISDAEARDRYAKVSGSTEETEAHVDLWRAIREDRLAAVTDDVERILGRKAIPLRQWAFENASCF
jgi:uncharacterized protein YbjT (DUF2867 family)